MPTIVTLLTDFGLEDEYAGVMKGVILGINPSAKIVDISHNIPPGDIVSASWLLAWSWRYFPRRTVHLVVVDPGVGSMRKILCFEVNGHRFLAPDNGVISQVIVGIKQPRIYALTHRRYALRTISHTFHGRDIFAPAAGHLSKGLASHRLGPRVMNFQRLPISTVKSSPGGLVGRVIVIDRFGNAVTNIASAHGRELSQRNWVNIRVKERFLHGIRTSYGAVSKGSLLAMIGSHDLLEIAMNGRSAAKHLCLKVGDPIEITKEEKK